MRSLFDRQRVGLPKVSVDSLKSCGDEHRSTGNMDDVTEELRNRLLELLLRRQNHATAG